MLGAVVAEQSSEFENALGAYGRHIGCAFQLVDDALDYSASTESLGKNVGDDLAEGKPTLPLLHAMWHGTEAQSKMIRQAIEQGGLEHLDKIMSAIESTGGITYTFARAQAEADNALTALTAIPQSPYRKALEALADFAVHRSS